MIQDQCRQATGISAFMTHTPGITSLRFRFLILSTIFGTWAYPLDLLIEFGIFSVVLSPDDDNDDRIIIHMHHTPTMCQTQYIFLATFIITFYYTQFIDKEIEGQRYEMTFSTTTHNLEGTELKFIHRSS